MTVNDSKVQIQKTATVRSVVPLSLKQQQKLEVHLHKIIGEKITVVYEIDRKILGGFTVRLEDWFLDASLALDLQKIKEILA